MEFIAKLPKLSRVDAKLVLSDYYDTVYGIYNHSTNQGKRPLASVALYEQEDINTDSLLEESIKRYVTSGIKDIYGLSLEEFYSYPKDVCAMLIDQASKELAKKDQITSTIIKEIDGSK